MPYNVALNTSDFISSHWLLLSLFGNFKQLFGLLGINRPAALSPFFVIPKINRSVETLIFQKTSTYGK
jgi:hypothetical protein